jgi:hypothetical protein
MERRRIIGAAVFSAAIAGGGVAGVVLGTPATSSAATGAATTTTPGGRRGWGMDQPRPELAAAAKAIGISTATLQSDLESGKTIAQVAKSKNVPVQTVIDAMVAAAKTSFESNLSARITAEVNGTLQRPDAPGGPDGPDRGFGFRGGFGLDAAAKAIGVDTTTLLDALKSGKTIAAVAASKHVPVKTVVDAMVAAAKTQFDAMVKSGRLTADQAAKIEANLTQMITDQVNGTFSRPGLGFGRGGPGAAFGPGMGNGFGHGFGPGNDGASPPTSAATT